MATLAVQREPSAPGCVPVSRRSGANLDTKKGSPPRCGGRRRALSCVWRSGLGNRSPDAVGAGVERTAAATEQAEQTVGRRHRFGERERLQCFEELPTEAGGDGRLIGELLGAVGLPGKQRLQAMDQHPGEEQAKTRCCQSARQQRRTEQHHADQAKESTGPADEASRPEEDRHHQAATDHQCE